jgi:hypothetical protein
MPQSAVRRQEQGSQRKPFRVITLTLRIDYAGKKLSGRFIQSLAHTDRRRSRCSCFQDERYHVPSTKHSNSDIHRPRFVFEKPSQMGKAQTAISKVQKDTTTCDFWIEVTHLLRFLSRLCNGQVAKNRMLRADDTKMHPFREHSLGATSVCKKLLEKISTPLNETEMKDHGLGYIYVLRSQDPSTRAELKIGFSQYHPQHRAQELARCMNKPEVVAHSQVLPHAKRVESLIHAELGSFRKAQWCAWCHRTHQEWFTVAYSQAREVIIRWSRFMLLRPYIGRELKNELCLHLSLVKDEFKYVELKALGAFWDNAISAMPLDESEYSKEQQLGTYLNAIWMYRNIQSWTKFIPFKSHSLCFEDFFEKYFCSEEDNQIRMALSDLDSDTLRRIFLDEETSGAQLLPTSDVLRQILFGPQTCPDTRFFDLGYWALPDPESKRQRLLREVSGILKQLNAVKTGSRSVTNPEPGTMESPMGNATMLPVLKLSELEHVSQPVMRFLGYDGTNYGFQFVQEAYQRGDWDGNFPRSTKYRFANFDDFWWSLRLLRLPFHSLIQALSRILGWNNHNSTSTSQASKPATTSPHTK